MADPLYNLLVNASTDTSDSKKLPATEDGQSPELSMKYLSRLLSLRLTDLTTTEPQSIAQATQSNLLSIQALSSRSHKTTTLSSDHLSTLRESLPHLSNSTKNVREAIPALDESTVTFASAYSKTRDNENAALTARKQAQLLARQADKLQDILELPSLLSAAIASAGSGTAGSANYSQALDLFAHIKRLQIIFPDSQLVKSVFTEAEVAMKDMTTNLLTSLRSQNIRLAAAIRTIGWLRRVVPELSNPQHEGVSSTTDATRVSEGSFAALFLTARLATFISMTQALAPLRELADQETDRRTQPLTPTNPGKSAGAKNTPASTNGHQTERYLKRYIEIFREQSFSTISMYRNIFPDEERVSLIPASLQTFPMHLVEMLMETLRAYLPNVTDPSARESLLMQVLYAANSLGRLGADFSMMISLLDWDVGVSKVAESNDSEEQKGSHQDAGGESMTADESNEQISGPNKSLIEPEWLRVIKKHRVQSARLDALAAGQESSTTKSAQDITVR